MCCPSVEKLFKLKTGALGSEEGKCCQTGVFLNRIDHLLDNAVLDGGKVTIASLHIMTYFSLLVEQLNAALEQTAQFLSSE